jgi:hypothetical protein
VPADPSGTIGESAAGSDDPIQQRFVDCHVLGTCLSDGIDVDFPTGRQTVA